MICAGVTPTVVTDGIEGAVRKHLRMATECRRIKAIAATTLSLARESPISRPQVTLAFVAIGPGTTRKNPLPMQDQSFRQDPSWAAWAHETPALPDHALI